MAEAKKFTRFPVAFTAPARLLYAEQLVTPKGFKQKGTNTTSEPKYGALAVIPANSPDLAALSAAVKSAAAEHGGVAEVNAKKGFPLRKIEKFFAEGKVPEGLEGHIGLRVTAGAAYGPALKVVKGGKIISIETEEQRKGLAKEAFYGGVEGFLEVSITATQSGGDNFITAYVNHALSLCKGKRIGGERAAPEAWSGYVGQHSTVDPTKDLDDEIPF